MGRASKQVAALVVLISVGCGESDVAEQPSSPDAYAAADTGSGGDDGGDAGTGGTGDAESPGDAADAPDSSPDSAPIPGPDGSPGDGWCTSPPDAAWTPSLAVGLGDPLDDRGGRITTDAVGGAITSTRIIDITSADGSPSVGDQGFSVERRGANGSLVYRRAFAQVGSLRAPGVAAGGGNDAFLAGDFSGLLDFGPPTTPLDPMEGGSYVARLDTEGVGVWSRTFGGPSGSIALVAITVAPDGDPVVAGVIRGTVDPGDGTLNADAAGDAFIAKLDAATGSTLWSRGFSGPGLQGITALAAFADGGYAIGGIHDTAWSIGSDAIAAFDDTDVFVALLDADAEPVWARGYGSTSDDNLLDVATQCDGGIVAVGGVGTKAISFGGPPLPPIGPEEKDSFVVAHDAAGSLVFGTRIDVRAAIGVATDPDGGIFVSGGYEKDDVGWSLAPPSYDGAYLARLAPDGTPLWMRGTVAACAVGGGLASRGDGSLWWTGTYCGNVSFGSTVLAAAGVPLLGDTFLVMIEP